MRAGLGCLARALLRGRPRLLLRPQRRSGKARRAALPARRWHTSAGLPVSGRSGASLARLNPGRASEQLALCPAGDRGPRDCGELGGREGKHCFSKSILTGGLPGFRK